VGPLTVAMLMANTVALAERHEALEKGLTADENA
jgi:5,10-methylene-tetrahydrofolate dehydrogenase/methenyl tetrahydrofolate cyclohydrolase